MIQEPSILNLEGTLTIKTVTETRDRLIAAVTAARDGKQPLEITISEDCNCDITLPQLLLAAQTAADAEGLQLRIKAAEQGAFPAILERAGFTGSGMDGSLLRINGDNT